MSLSINPHIKFENAVSTITRRMQNYSPKQFPAPNARPAAVMILLQNIDGVPHLLFTRRTEQVEHHKGQISFPGGMKDDKDSSLLRTALRETEEEIGVNGDKIRVLGQLDDLYTVTDFLITPFAGILFPPYEFKLSRDEVAEVLQVPLSLFLSRKQFEVKKWEYRGKKYDVYFYYHHHHVIWGATAFILNRFIHLVFDYNPAPNPVYRDPRNEDYLRENIIRGGGRE